MSHNTSSSLCHNPSASHCHTTCPPLHVTQSVLLSVSQPVLLSVSHKPSASLCHITHPPLHVTLPVRLSLSHSLSASPMSHDPSSSPCHTTCPPLHVTQPVHLSMSHNPSASPCHTTFPPLHVTRPVRLSVSHNLSASLCRTTRLPLHVTQPSASPCHIAVRLSMSHNPSASPCHTTRPPLSFTQCLQAKTKTSSAIISALQYADDTAVPCLTADRLLRSLDVMSETYLRAGLIINTTKTEILSTSSPHTPTFSISGNQLKNSENFTYLCSNLSFSGDFTNDIQRRFNLASSAFGRLSKRVFGKQDFTIHTRIAVYDAVVISTILYGCETWVPYRRHIRLLESFHIRRLQLILGLRWWHKVTHSEIRSMAGIPSIKSMLLHRLLRLLGHVIRMPHSRVPHCVLCGRLRLGRRSVGGQKKRFKESS